MNFHLKNLREMGFLFYGLLSQAKDAIAMKRSEIVPSIIEGMKCEQESVEKILVIKGTSHI